MCCLTTKHCWAQFSLVTNFHLRKKLLNHWFKEVSGTAATRKPLSAYQFPVAIVLTFMSNTVSEPQIPSRCGDVITLHSAYHGVMQRVCSFALETGRLQLQTSFIECCFFMLKEFFFSDEPWPVPTSVATFTTRCCYWHSHSWLEHRMIINNNNFFIFFFF